MDFSIKTADKKNSLDTIDTDCIVIGIYDDHKLTDAAIALDTNGVITRALESGDISGKQAARLLHSHMSLGMCLDFFRRNAKAVSYCRKIFLLHGSRANGDAKIFKEAVQRETGKPVIVCTP